MSLRVCQSLSAGGGIIVQLYQERPIGRANESSIASSSASITTSAGVDDEHDHADDGAGHGDNLCARYVQLHAGGARE